MSLQEQRPTRAAMPENFDHWLPARRLLWRRIQESETWPRGWAHVTLRRLAEGLGSKPTAKRALDWLIDAGEFERRVYGIGAELPGGGVAWCDVWYVVPGSAMRSRTGATTAPRPDVIGGGITSDRSPDQNGEGGGSPEQGGPIATKPPPIPAKNKRLSLSEDEPSRSPSRTARDEEPRFKDSCLGSGSFSRSGSKSSKSSSKVVPEGGGEEQPPVNPETRSLAERLLRHYAASADLPVKHFRRESIARVAECIDASIGEDHHRAAIDDAVNESRKNDHHPKLEFVFNRRHFARRLLRAAENANVAYKTDPAGEDPMLAGFTRTLDALDEALAGGADVAAALERARPYVENGVVTDAPLLARYRDLETRAEPPIPSSDTEEPPTSIEKPLKADGETAAEASSTTQDARPMRSGPSAASSPSAVAGERSGAPTPEQLAALFGDAAPPPRSSTPEPATAGLKALADPRSMQAELVIRGEPGAATMTREELAELEELYRIDNEARIRLGLPPRYPMQWAAA